jgi:hypothetical protein
MQIETAIIGNSLKNSQTIKRFSSSASEYISKRNKTPYHKEISALSCSLQHYLQ